MSRLVGLISIFLLLGVSQLQVSGLVYDIEASENEAIRILDKDFTNLKNNMNSLANHVLNLTHEAEKKSQPILTEFSHKLSSMSGFFEEAINTYVKANISMQTCGIMDIRSTVMATYDVAHNCVKEMLQKIDKEMNAIKEITSYFEEYFPKTKEDISNCKVLKSDNYEIALCILDGFTFAEEYMVPLGEIAAALDEVVAAYEVPAVFSKCLGTTVVENLMKKVNEVTSCLTKKVPAIGQVTNRINRITQVTGHRILQITDGYFERASGYVHYLKDKVFPIILEIEEHATDFGRSVRNFRKAINHAVKNVWQSIKG